MAERKEKGTNLNLKQLATKKNILIGKMHVHKTTKPGHYKIQINDKIKKNAGYSGRDKAVKSLNNYNRTQGYQP